MTSLDVERGGDVKIVVMLGVKTNVGIRCGMMMGLKPLSMFDVVICERNPSTVIVGAIDVAWKMCC